MQSPDVSYPYRITKLLNNNMCGICGFFGFSKSMVDKDTLWTMTNTLNHRGPDDAGVFHSGNVGLGHTRLSIIDLSKAGHQPMFSNDRSVVMAYNGELYNYLDLRRCLIDKGRVFMSNTDTEVVLQSYMEWGTDAFSEFEGMFACAIWDSREQSLNLVRDRFGIKPLYYSRLDSEILFGSEIKALLASGRISKEINTEGLHEYMWYGNALGENTIFKGIYKLLPGHYMTVTNSKINVRQYWRIEDTQQIEPSIGDATHTILEKLETSVKRHLMSDVPVGIFLSGGVDSSAITALASKHYSGSLKTFSVGFDFSDTNELPEAGNVAKLFNTEHNELYISGADLPEAIESLVQCHDEPFADAANIPLYLLCRELKGSIKVILQGDGGDEMFAGYRRYNVLSYKQLWYLISILAFHLQEILPRNSHYYRYKRFFSAMRQTEPAMRMALLLTQDSITDSPVNILNTDVYKSMLNYDPFTNYKYWHSVLEQFDPLQRMLYTDCMIQLPNTFLEKVDKSTMANSIEVRVPFLDNNLTDYVLGLPSDFKVRLGSKKWILKRSLKNILPDKILHAPKKGFSVPVDQWLKGPLAGYMCSVLLDSNDRYIFNRAVLETKIDEHISGKKNNGFMLWKAINLAIWLDNYL